MQHHQAGVTISDISAGAESRQPTAQAGGLSRRHRTSRRPKGCCLVRGPHERRVVDVHRCGPGGRARGGHPDADTLRWCVAPCMRYGADDCAQRVRRLCRCKPSRRQPRSRPGRSFCAPPRQVGSAAGWLELSRWAAQRRWRRSWLDAAAAVAMAAGALLLELLPRMSPKHGCALSRYTRGAAGVPCAHCRPCRRARLSACWRGGLTRCTPSPRGQWCAWTRGVGWVP